MEKQYYDMIIKSLASGVVLQDRSRKILYCNEVAATMLGLDVNQLLGKTAYDPEWACFKEDGTLYEADERSTARVFKDGISVQNDIMGVRKPDGSISWISVNAEPIFETDKATPDYVVVTYIDITDLKNKERELAESNIELERFAYVASHDLQEPLRKINTFLSLFLSKNQNNFDEKSKTYLDKVTDSTRRMQNLIDDLLNFSRANNIKGEIEEINCNDKINYIRENYNLLPTDKKVLINSNTLPVIKGYKTQILSLFQNLINNAIKYNKSDNPEVQIDSKDTGKEYIFSIKDNGIGIEQEDFDKIFLPFQRLHGKSEFSGSGIGLATCKKIIEKHKGKIWLESEVGKGSTFYFSVPKG
jgi:PAS domain S-box-containing protein